MNDAKSFFSSLLDMSFSDFFTPKIIKVLFILAIIGSAIWALALLVAGIASGSAGGILGGLIGAPIVFILAVILSRVYLELLLVMFRIAENTGRLVNHAEGSRTDAQEHGQPSLDKTAVAQVLGSMCQLNSSPTVRYCWPSSTSSSMVYRPIRGCSSGSNPDRMSAGTRASSV